MSDAHVQSCIEALEKVARAIRKLEGEAAHALYTDNNKAGYVAKLHEKTKMLIGLPELVAEMVATMPLPLQRFLKDRLGGMAFSAEKAMRLDSIFYMSALLYPEEYRDGDLNDLENLIGWLSEGNEQMTARG